MTQLYEPFFFLLSLYLHRSHLNCLLFPHLTNFFRFTFFVPDICSFTFPASANVRMNVRHPIEMGGVYWHQLKRKIY